MNTSDREEETRLISDLLRVGSRHYGAPPVYIEPCKVLKTDRHSTYIVFDGKYFAGEPYMKVCKAKLSHIRKIFAAFLMEDLDVAYLLNAVAKYGDRVKGEKITKYWKSFDIADIENKLVVQFEVEHYYHRIAYIKLVFGGLEVIVGSQE